MTDMSPAAQAVLNATDYPEDWATRIRVAAALRAAVDEVLPLSAPDQLPPAGDSPSGHYVHGWAQSQLNARIDLLNIATELENANG